MKCPECSFLNKKGGKCEMCGFKLSEEVDKGNKKKDKNFFEAIWKERDHICEVCCTPLGDTYNPVFFSHVLTKGAYPKFRHYHKNIVLMCFEDHQEWEFTDRKDPKWNSVRDLSEELIIEYYSKS